MLHYGRKTAGSESSFVEAPSSVWSTCFENGRFSRYDANLYLPRAVAAAPPSHHPLPSQLALDNPSKACDKYSQNCSSLLKAICATCLAYITAPRTVRLILFQPSWLIPWRISLWDIRVNDLMELSPMIVRSGVKEYVMPPIQLRPCIPQYLRP